MDPLGHPRGPGDTGPGAWPTGWSVRHVAETGSTNADLLADLLAPDRTVLVADHQTAGRGRLDRTWEAPRGANLLVSVLFRVVPDDPGELMRRLAVAVATAVRGAGAPTAALKWPNDVVVDDRKLAGLLAQRAADGSVVVGAGVNVGWSPAGAVDLGGAVTPLELLDQVLAAYDALPADLHHRYRGMLSTIGRRVRIELPAGELVGTAVDVERDGRLVVVDDEAIARRVGVGDVVHLRPA